MTKMQVSCSPMARCSRAAVTAESTPPDKAQMTRPSPTCSRMRAMASEATLPGVHDPSHWQMRNRKFSRISVPSGVWFTSGWNCSPNISRPFPMAATGEFW